MNDVDWIAILKHVTAKNVAKWIAVCAFGIIAIAGAIAFVVLLWNSV